ncbi:MAG TPA: bifunctional transaldolase/phosoglucose isomerase, partial [Blastocatellia bacterium]|nr:bifunctional transaldolase/phosoglucose isomerase [Blastocatellia bacterium]
MSTNPLVEVAKLGQSIWYDNIRRSLITSGDLKKKIEEDDLRGVTSNPSIFEKAIGGSSDYDDQLTEMALQNKTADEIYQSLTIRDIQMTTDLFRSVYDKTSGLDGYVSLECSPELAHDTEGTITEARRLWREIGRPNAMIKIPATPEGIPAVQQCISEGINVNVTLIFSVQMYEKVAEAYIRGLERRLGHSQSVANIASVASFFISRIDSLVDKKLDELIRSASDDAQKSKLRALQGQTAIANAKIAYQKFKGLFHGERFAKLRAAGAWVQRPLWASTSTKNPNYSDVYYANELIGPDTVDTVPPATFSAFRDHGDPTLTMEKDLDGARAMLAGLGSSGVSLDQATAELLDDGVKQFKEAFQKLMTTIEQRRDNVVHGLSSRQSESTVASAEVAAGIQQLVQQDFVRRMWRKDASLWKTEPEQQKIISTAMGWLTVVDLLLEHADDLKTFADQVRSEGYQHAVLLGMGGSSLCPEVLRRTFGRVSGYPELLVLDSTVPDSVRAVRAKIDPAKTMFIVASKSGSTIEPNVFHEYFYAETQKALGAHAGKNFVAITDPGTEMEKTAHARNFRRVFLNPADIGGRYSALSYFGMVPAALAGYDFKEILHRASRAVHGTERTVKTEENPAARLGAALGMLAKKGRDKLTIVVPSPIDSLGLWIEQLIAESTGKEGRGILPVFGETLAGPPAYGNDRVFVFIQTRDSGNDLEAKVGALEAAGHPVIRRVIHDALDLGEEFFVWEFATPIAGAMIGINPFDQPNVQESKDNTKRLLGVYEKQKNLGE